MDDFNDNPFDDNPFDGNACDEPATDINAAIPTSLSHVVGQRSVIEQVKVGLDSCQIDGTKFDHSLLAGPPGLGKTAVAKIIAEEMAADLCEVLGQSIKTAADLNAVLLGATEKSIVFIDEAHELRAEFQTALYLSLDKGKIIVSGGKKPQSIGLSDFSLLLATTDEHGLLAPLRDRMKLLLRFEFYSNEDLRTLVEQRAKALRWEVDDCTVLGIANRARGTPRIALRLLQACRRVCRAEGETAITAKHLLRACELEQMDFLGLGPTEKRYLLILAEQGTRLNIIASTLGLPARTVSQVIEPFLIRLGLVVKDDQGRRELSAKGREHVFNPFRSDDR